MVTDLGVVMKVDKELRNKILKTLNKFRIIKKKNALSNCYEWSGVVHEGKVPKIYINGVTIGINRAAWIAHKGEIPCNHYVHSFCEEKSCTNPEHLFISRDKFVRPIPSKFKRAGRKRLCVDLPSNVVDQVKYFATKYDMTITKYLLNRLGEIMDYERKVERR